jgi:hypothetical protein
MLQYVRCTTSKDKKLETIQANLSEGYPACCGKERKRMKILKEYRGQTARNKTKMEKHSSWNEVFKADQKKLNKV